MPPSLRLSTLALIGLVAVASCAKKGRDTADQGAPAAPGPVATKVDPAAKAIANPDTRKIIRTGTLRITIGSYDESRAKLDALLAQVGGYIDSTQVSRAQNTITDATIVIRVPSQGFGDVVTRFRELGEIASESTNANDISDQFVDTDARLASAKVLEARLLELAGQKNGTIDQVLAVERELARVRGEIEGYEGHLRQWNDQVAMSTLTLVLSTKAPEIVATSTSFTGRITSTFHDSIHALTALAGWFVVMFIALLPWILVCGPIVLIARRVAAKLRG